MCNGHLIGLLSDNDRSLLLRRLAPSERSMRESKYFEQIGQSIARKGCQGIGR